MRRFTYDPSIMARLMDIAILRRYLPKAIDDKIFEPIPTGVLYQISQP